MRKDVYEVAIVLDLEMIAHSLNNEGVSGCITKPREFTVGKGKEKRDGITGQALKRILVDEFRNIAMGDKGRLCNPCKKHDPRKIAGKEGEPIPVEDAVKNCEVCDTFGFVTAKRRELLDREKLNNKRLELKERLEGQELVNSKRRELESVLEQVIAQMKELGLNPDDYPDRVKSGTNMSRKSVFSVADIISLEEGEVEYTSHMRTPTQEDGNDLVWFVKNHRSGHYGLTLLFEAFRIGKVDETHSYVVDEKERLQRMVHSIDAIEKTLMSMKGAGASTQMPHIKGMSGCISITRKMGRIGTVSPFFDKYVELNREITLGGTPKNDYTPSGRFFQVESAFDLIRALDYIKKECRPARLE